MCSFIKMGMQDLDASGDQCVFIECLLCADSLKYSLCLGRRTYACEHIQNESKTACDSGPSSGVSGLFSGRSGGKGMMEVEVPGKGFSSQCHILFG